MTDIQVFNHNQFGQIRTMVMPDGQVGFVGKDVAEVLGMQKLQMPSRSTLTMRTKGSSK